jgi:hypothetical protein
MHLFDQLCDAGISLRKIDIRKTRRKTGDLVRLRFAIGNILTKQYGLTTTEVGRLMGRDHSTIVHYRGLHTARYRCDDEYAHIYDTLSAIANKYVDPGAASIEDVVDLIRKIGE